MAQASFSLLNISPRNPPFDFVCVCVYVCARQCPRVLVRGRAVTAIRRLPRREEHLFGGGRDKHSLPTFIVRWAEIGRPR